MQGVSSVILAFLTFFYLKEVARTRKMTEKVLELEWTTDLEVDLSTSHYIPDLTARKIHIPYNLTVSSTGKLPVDLLGGQLIIKLGEETTTHDIRAVKKLGSSTMQSFTLSIPRNETEIALVSQLNTGAIIQWESPLPQIGAEIKLEYKDGLTDKARSKGFKYRYEFNKWINL